MGALERQQNEDHWRLEVTRRLDEHTERLDRGESRMDDLGRSIRDNNEMTARIEKGVTDILAIFAAFQGFAKVGGWMGKGLKWAAGIVIAVGVIYWFWKTGDLPRHE